MTFAAALPCMIAAPALNGFYLSLGPSLAAQVLGSPDLLWGGLVIFLVTGTGAAATVAFRGLSGPAAMLVGCLTLVAGAVMTLAAIETASAPPSWPAPRWPARAPGRPSSWAPTAS